MTTTIIDRDIIGSTDGTSTDTEETRTPQAIVTRTCNVTRDPELRISPKGTAFARFGLAYTPYAPKDAPEPETTFYDVVAFASLAENVAECLHRGDRVIVSGRPEVEEYEAKDGSGPRITKKIVADSIGAELRFATVTIAKPERRTVASAAPSDNAEEPF